jgi:chromosome segregation ATPase
MDFRRIHAQRQAELDEVLLKSLHEEQARLTSRLKTVRHEIDGMQRVIDQYQAHMREQETVAGQLEAALARLDGQEREIRSDQERWSGKLAG